MVGGYYNLKYEYLVFDLDGTISDPKDGIVRSLNFALSAHGFPSQDEYELSTYIGPPLDSTFKAITKSDNTELISSLITKYRVRYSDVGFSENVLYDGIPEALEQLSTNPGITLGICTSKRTDFAARILEYFGLSHFFSFVSGGDVGIEKWQQLQSLCEQGVISQNSLMIGDRYVDLTAAHRNGLRSAGVLWGYGSLTELKQHDPAHILSSPCELAALAA
ncbi:MAG: phosphoglycolate phosphatase [Desulforhopalus sp.]|jgi:phosphoglycolate phosphatase